MVALLFQLRVFLKGAKKATTIINHAKVNFSALLIILAGNPNFCILIPSTSCMSKRVLQQLA